MRVCSRVSVLPPTLDPELASVLVEAGPDALVVCDDAGRIVLANAETERLFGYGPGELVGELVERLVPERHHAAHVGSRSAYTLGPTLRPMGLGRRLLGKRRDGSEFQAEVSLSPVRTARGLFIAAAVRDVSELRRMEIALAEAEARLRDLVEQAPDGIFVADLSGRYTEVNGAACRMLGYARDELVGKTIMDLIPEAELPRLAAERAALETPGYTHVSEWTVRRKDGTLVPVEVGAKILADGRWQAIVRDIRERKRIEAEREAALRQLRTVLEQCPVGIAIFSSTSSDQAIVLNERAKQIVGRPDLVPRVGVFVPFMQWPDGTPLTPSDAPTLRAMRGELVAPMEIVIVHPDGRRVPIQVRGAPLLGPDGSVTGGVVAFEDITAVKDLERLRTEWNAIIAHDLRNPLNIVVLHTHLLERHARGDHVMWDSVQEIRGAAARLNRMIHDLLDLSRLEARSLKLLRAPTQLGEVLRKAVGRAILTAPDRAIELALAADLPPVLADADRIAQVMDNLLTNAIKYGGSGTPIAVTATRTGDGLEVAVTNQGVGIPPDAVPRLFQRFHRASDGQLAGVKGIGLGLYIARELIEAHGGRIGVESEPGGSTTFRFSLPAAEAS